MEYEIETTEEALERKTFEHLEQAVHRFETKQITLKELGAYMSALWDITSGLISEKVSDVLIASVEYTKVTEEHLSGNAYMIGKNGIAIIKWRQSKASFAILSPQMKVIKKASKVFEDSEKALASQQSHDFATSVFKKLKSQGFKEI